MKISEAVEKAMQQDGMIYRSSIQRKYGRHDTLIKPTNSYDACIIISYRGGKEIVSCRNWNPTGDDLMADDWKLWDKNAENPPAKYHARQGELEGITIDLPTHSIQQEAVVNGDKRKSSGIIQFTYKELALLNRMIAIALMSGEVEFNETSESVQKKVADELTDQILR